MTGAFESGRWSCYRRSLSRSSDERTSIYAIQRLKWRARRVLPSLCVPLDRRASMLFDLTRAFGGPPG